MTEANTLAYNDTERFTAVKSFIVQASGLQTSLALERFFVLLYCKYFNMLRTNTLAYFAAASVKTCFYWQFGLVGDNHSSSFQQRVKFMNIFENLQIV
jgi:hypothetical protein